MMKWIKSFVVVCVLAMPCFVYAAVDINLASEPELAAALKGVGVKKARAIVDYRKTHGAFKSVDELAGVKGISLKTIEKNRQNISVNMK